jgi:LemA protein
MMLVFIAFVCICCVFIMLSSYRKLLSKYEKIILIREAVNIKLDSRFKIFEDLINNVRQIMDYEETILKEIVQLRLEAQAEKSKNNYNLQLSIEDKITLLSIKLKDILEQYPLLKDFKDNSKINNEFLYKQKELKELNVQYELAIKDYLMSRKKMTGIILSLIIKKFSLIV